MTDAGEIDYDKLPWHVGVPLRLFDPWVTRPWEKEDGTIDYAEMPWAEVLTRGYGNFGESATTNLKDMYTMLKTPIQSADMLAQIGTQASAKTLSGMIKHFLAYDEDLYNVMFKEPDTQLVDMIIEVYKQNYNLDENQAGLKRYIAEEPASFAEDISMLATVFFTGSGAVAGRAGTAMKQAFRLTPRQKSMLNFNKYLQRTTGRAPRVSEAMAYLSKHTPDALKWYGDRAYYIGVGTAAEGYAPGYWAKLAHMTLNYMDPSAWPLMAPADLIQGSYRFMRGDLANASKIDDSIDEFAEYLHTNFKDESIETHADFREFVGKVKRQYQGDVAIDEANQFLNWVMNGEAPNLAMPMPSGRISNIQELVQMYRQNHTDAEIENIAMDAMDAMDEVGGHNLLPEHISNMEDAISGHYWDDTIMSHLWQFILDRRPERLAGDANRPIPSQVRSIDDIPLLSARQTLISLLNYVPEDRLHVIARNALEELRIEHELSEDRYMDMIGVIRRGSWASSDLEELWEVVHTSGRGRRELQSVIDEAERERVALASDSANDIVITSANQLEINTVSEAKEAIIRYLPDHTIKHLLETAMAVYGLSNFQRMHDAIVVKNWSNVNLDPLYEYIHQENILMHWLETYGEFNLTPDDAMRASTAEAIAQAAEKRSYGIELEFLADESRYARSSPNVEMNNAQEMVEAFKNYLSPEAIRVEARESWGNLDARYYEQFELDQMEQAINDFDWDNPILESVWDEMFYEGDPMSILQISNDPNMPRSLSIGDIASKYGGDHKGDTSLHRRVDSNTGEEVSGEDHEIALPKMVGDEGFQAINDIVEELEAAGAQINDSTGLHVHISKEDLTPEQVANIVRAWGKYEWAIDQLYGEWRRGHKGYSSSIYEKGPESELEYLNRLDDNIRYRVKEAMEFIEEHGTLEKAITAIQHYENKVFSIRKFDEYINSMDNLLEGMEPNTPEYRSAKRQYLRGGVEGMLDVGGVDKLRDTFSIAKSVPDEDVQFIAKGMVDSYLSTGNYETVVSVSGSLQPFDEARFLDFIAGAEDFMDELVPGEDANMHRVNVLLTQGVYSMSPRMLMITFSLRKPNMTFDDMQIAAESMVRKYVMENDLHGAAVIAGAVEYDALRQVKEFVNSVDPELNRTYRLEQLYEKVFAMEKTEIADLFNLGNRLTSVELMQRVDKILRGAVDDNWIMAELYVDTGFSLGENQVYKYQNYEDAVNMLREAEKALQSISVPWEQWLDSQLERKTKITAHSNPDGGIADMIGRNKINVRGTGSGDITIEFRGHDGTLDGDRIVAYVKFLRNFVERFKDERVRPASRIGTADEALKEIMPGQPTSAWHLVGQSPEEFLSELPEPVQAMYKFIEDEYNADFDHPRSIEIALQRYEVSTLKDYAEQTYGTSDMEELRSLAEDAVAARHQLPQDPKVVQERVQQLNVSLERGDPIGVIGKVVESPEEFAAMAQFLRHPSRENTWIVYLKDGQIVQHEAMTLNASSETIAPNPIMLEERIDVLGADSFVLIHNHPGGVAEFSEADLEIALRYDAILGKKFAGMQATNSGTYAKTMRGADGDLEYPQNNLKIPSELVGWDTDSAVINAGWKNEQRTLQDDPLYQIIIDDSETRELWQDVLKESTGEEGGIDSKLLEENILLFGKRLQTDKNWIVVGLVGESGRLDAMAEYRGLQNLTPPELYHFLRKRSDAFGGSQAMIWIGEGDWYTNADEALQPFTDLLDAQYPASYPFSVEPDVTPGGIASVVVASEDKVLLPKQQESWTGKGTLEEGSDKSMVEELFRSFGDEEDTGLPPLKRYNDIYDRPWREPVATGNLTKTQFEQAIKDGKITVGGQRKPQTELQKNQLPRHRAEHRTEKRKIYRKMREEERIRPSGENWDDEGTQMTRLDYESGDSNHVYFTYGDGGNDDVLTYGGYGFIFDPEVLLKKYNAQVGPDISHEYAKVFRQAYDDVLKKHGISQEEYVDGLANNEIYDIDNEMNNTMSGRYITDEPNPIVTEIIATGKQKISELQSEKRVQGEAASEHLSNQELWEGMWKGRPEFLVEGDVDLNEGVIGIIENFKIKMLTEDSIGKPPTEWKYERGQVEWNDVFDSDDTDNLQRRAFMDYQSFRIPSAELPKLNWEDAESLMRDQTQLNVLHTFHDPNIADKYESASHFLVDTRNRDVVAVVLRNPRKEKAYYDKIGVNTRSASDIMRQRNRQLGMYTTDLIKDILSHVGFNFSDNQNIYLQPDILSINSDLVDALLPREKVTRSDLKDQYKYRPYNFESNDFVLDSWDTLSREEIINRLLYIAKQTAEELNQSNKYASGGNLKSPLALEHMTRNKDRYNQIRRSGKLTGGHADFIDSDASNMIFMSVGASWRSEAGTGSYGFVFNPRVLIEKYDATPSPSNIENAIENGFDTGFTMQEYYDYWNNQKMRKGEEDEWEFARRITYDYLKEKDVDIYDLMIASGTADEMQIKGPIDLKDAIGVVEDNVLKTITYTSRDNDPMDWVFNTQTGSALVKSELDVFSETSKESDSLLIKESPFEKYTPPVKQKQVEEAPPTGQTRYDESQSRLEKSSGPLQQLKWDDAERMMRLQDEQLNVLHTYYDKSVEEAYPEASHFILDEKTNTPIAVVLRDDEKELAYYLKIAESETPSYDVFKRKESQVGKGVADLIRKVIEDSGYGVGTQNIYLRPDVDAVTEELVESVLPKKTPQSGIFKGLSRSEVVNRLTYLSKQTAQEIYDSKKAYIEKLKHIKVDQKSMADVLFQGVDNGNK